MPPSIFSTSQSKDCFITAIPRLPSASTNNINLFWGAPVAAEMTVIDTDDCSAAEMRVVSLCLGTLSLPAKRSFNDDSFLVIRSHGTPPLSTSKNYFAIATTMNSTMIAKHQNPCF